MEGFTLRRTVMKVARSRREIRRHKFMAQLRQPTAATKLGDMHMSESQNLGMESALGVHMDIEKSHNDRGGLQNDTPKRYPYRGSSVQGSLLPGPLHSAAPGPRTFGPRSCGKTAGSDLIVIGYCEILIWNPERVLYEASKRPLTAPNCPGLGRVPF